MAEAFQRECVLVDACMLHAAYRTLHACVSTLNDNSVSVSTETGLIMMGRGDPC